jgi:hypothetical protein
VDGKKGMLKNNVESNKNSTKTSMTRDTSGSRWKYQANYVEKCNTRSHRCCLLVSHLFPNILIKTEMFITMY